MKVHRTTEVTSKLKEQRRYLRYAVSGSLVLDVDGQSYSGIPFNISIGGILFQADTRLQTGACGTIRLQVFGFSDSIVANVRVVRTVGTATAAVFLEPPVELARLISLLAG
jgi:hypothetical protein